MKSAQVDVEGYLERMKRYVDCLVDEQNDAVDEDKQVLDEWNDAVERFNNS